MTVYLLHFDRPLAEHAQHYLGSTDNLTQRLAEHAAGSGARITAAAVAAGISWQLARTWDGNRKRERQLKRYKKARRLCPLCDARAGERMR